MSDHLIRAAVSVAVFLAVTAVTYLAWGWVAAPVGCDAQCISDGRFFALLVGLLIAGIVATAEWRNDEGA